MTVQSMRIVLVGWYNGRRRRGRRRTWERSSWIFDLYGHHHDGISNRHRHAKIKIMANKSLETGEDINDMPESMRQYLQIQAMEFGRGGLSPSGHQGALGEGGQGRVRKYHLRYLNARVYTH